MSLILILTPMIPSANFEADSFELHEGHKIEEELALKLMAMEKLISSSGSH